MVSYNYNEYESKVGDTIISELIIDLLDCGPIGNKTSQVISLLDERRGLAFCLYWYSTANTKDLAKLKKKDLRDLVKHGYIYVEGKRIDFFSRTSMPCLQDFQKLETRFGILEQKSEEELVFTNILNTKGCTASNIQRDINAFSFALLINRYNKHRYVESVSDDENDF